MSAKRKVVTAVSYPDSIFNGDTQELTYLTRVEGIMQTYDTENMNFYELTQAYAQLAEIPVMRGEGRWFDDAKEYRLDAVERNR